MIDLYLAVMSLSVKRITLIIVLYRTGIINVEKQHYIYLNVVRINKGRDLEKLMARRKWNEFYGVA